MQGVFSAAVAAHDLCGEVPEKMPGSPRDMIVSAEQRFPVRIRVGVPPGGFGQRHAEMTAWLDENCGADGWAMTPSGIRGV